MLKILYIKLNVSLCVCLFVPYTNAHFWTSLNQTLHTAPPWSGRDGRVCMDPHFLTFLTFFLSFSGFFKQDVCFFVPFSNPHFWTYVTRDGGVDQRVERSLRMREVPGSIKIPYIRHYALDVAYVAQPDPKVTLKQFRHRIYSVLLAMAKVEKGTSEIRIIRKYPELPWPRVWANIHSANLPDAVKSTWCAAIHNIIATNERLAAIRLTPITACSRCGETANYCTGSPGAKLALWYGQGEGHE
jgi:hypothetical protein